MIVFRLGKTLFYKKKMEPIKVEIQNNLFIDDWTVFDSHL